MTVCGRGVRADTVELRHSSLRRKVQGLACVLSFRGREYSTSFSGGLAPIGSLSSKMSAGFDYQLHIFRSRKFTGVVNDALRFFLQTPPHRLPPAGGFVGGGVYALYYLGDCTLYAKLSEANRQKCRQPIYVGKGVPPGWRTARITSTEAHVLYGRLRQHARSIRQARNLRIGDFRCRFIILGGVERDLIVPVEAKLIRKYRPVWNSVVDGFGNHDPGSGRYNQAKSEWDVLHPGRPWADRLTGKSPPRLDVMAQVKQSLSKSMLP